MALNEATDTLETVTEKTSGGYLIGQSSSDLVAFHGATPTDQCAAMTATLTTITHTAPSTPDYAIQDLTNSNGYGFVTKDEGNTALKLLANLQVQVAEIKAILVEKGFIPS